MGLTTHEKVNKRIILRDNLSKWLDTANNESPVVLKEIVVILGANRYDDIHYMGEDTYNLIDKLNGPHGYALYKALKARAAP